MKEAAGEANLTVVAIILIAVVVAVATPLVTSLMRNASVRTCCNDAGFIFEGNQCFEVNEDGSRGDAVDRDDIVGEDGNCIGAAAE